LKISKTTKNIGHILMAVAKASNAPPASGHPLASAKKAAITRMLMLTCGGTIVVIGASSHPEMGA